ncbi:hypothetical protein KO02_12355 [Sphingobacterium sp. ML3W]|nr:hypothetical protein KO02_12355 [Sphingobacterium sp. ML3W]
MRTQENVTVYHCDFCKKKLFRKHAMLKHEEGCEQNPKNKIACFSGCRHLEHIEIEFDVFSHHAYEDGEPILHSRKSSCFKCMTKNTLMYTFAAEKRDLPSKYLEDFENQEPMPKIKCNLHEYHKSNFMEEFFT